MKSCIADEELSHLKKMTSPFPEGFHTNTFCVRVNVRPLVCVRMHARACHTPDSHLLCKGLLQETLLTNIDPRNSLKWDELKKDKPTTCPFSAVQSQFWTDGPLLSITTLNEGWNRTKSMHPSGTVHMHVKAAQGMNYMVTLKTI